MGDVWYQSKRLWAAAVLIVATITAGFGVEISEDTQGVMVSNLTAIGVAGSMLVSAVLDVWSKFKDRG